MGLMIRRFYGRVGLAAVLLVGVTSLFFLYSWPIEIDPTSQEFLEDQRCPACYGQDLCHEVYAGRLTLKRWTRYAHKNNYFCEFMVLQESAIYFRCCFSVTQKEVGWSWCMATGLKGLGLQHSGRSLHEYVILYF